MNQRKWVVLKYGGTSVSSAATWHAIRDRALEIMSKEGLSVWITVSAISQVTNKLIQCLVPGDDGRKSYEWVVERHHKLREDLQLDESEASPVFQMLHDLGRILEGVQLTGEVSPRLHARIVSTGELCSSLLGKLFLERELADHQGNYQVCRVDARHLLQANTLRKVDHDETRFLQADVMPRAAPQECEQEIKRQLGAGYSPLKHTLVITQGFIASTTISGVSHTCLLGRGGSDTSGTLFAALLNAKRCEIWTDVYGMFTCDPRLIPEARLIREMTYREAQELAAMGAKVLHPRCLGPAQWAGVPVEIRNTMDPAGSEGVKTRVCATVDEGSDADRPRVVAVTKRTDQILLTVENFDMWGTSGFLTKVFTPFGYLGIGVDLIATSVYSVSMTLDNVPGGFHGSVLASLVEELKALVPGGSVEVEERCAVVSIVGRRLRRALPNLARAFRCMQGYDLRMVTESAEDLNLSFVVADPRAVPGFVDKLVIKLYNALFALGEESQVNLEEEVAENLGASWDELRALHGVTPRPRLNIHTERHTPYNDMMVKSPRSAILVATDVEWMNPSSRSQLARMWNFAQELSPFLVVNCSSIAQIQLDQSEKARFRVSDLGQPSKRIVETLVHAGFGLECATIDEVRLYRSYCSEMNKGVVAFAPNHAASHDEYRYAVSCGCEEIVLDDEDIDIDEIDPMGQCDVFEFDASHDCFQLKRERVVKDQLLRRGSRAARWEELFRLEEGVDQGKRVLYRGDKVASAVALATWVTRTSEDEFRALRAPTKQQMKSLDISVLNCSRSEQDQTQVGDLVLYCLRNMSGATPATMWW